MSKCISKVNHSKVKVEENGRKAVFLNPAREDYEIGHIDGCLVSDNSTKADYFVSNALKTVFVELKGSNVDHACKQLFAAAEHDNVKEKVRPNIGFVIICSRFPSATTSTQRAQQQAKKQYGANFRIYCNQRELNINDC